MGFVDWSPRLELGIPSVDAQHRTLVDSLNRLFDALTAGPGQADVHHVLAFLLDYTEEHFRQEEHLMSEAGYPGLDHHHLEHAKLVTEVQELRAKQERRASFLSIEVLHFLREWLCNHILETDRKMADFLHLHGHAPHT